MTIKDAERMTGIPRANIRYYEREGLLSPARREENRYREYSGEDVEVLRRIRFFRLLGFSVQELRAMEAAPCLGPFLEKRLAELEERSREDGRLCELCRGLDGGESFMSLPLPPEEENRRRDRQVQSEDVQLRGVILLFGLLGSIFWGIVSLAMTVKGGYVADGMNYSHIWDSMRAAESAMRSLGLNVFFLLPGSAAVFLLTVITDARLHRGHRLVLLLAALLSVYGVAAAACTLLIWRIGGFI